MHTVTSKDGTSIAYERFGEGPPLILIGGAFNDRRSPVAGVPLAQALAPGRCVYAYDRRGRGDSGDTAPYAPDRELEDLGALIDEAGGHAALFGHSSGGGLALAAAATGLGVTRLAVFEPPYTTLSAEASETGALAREIERLVAAGARGEAVELFQRSIGIPAEVVEQLRHAPFRPALDAIAHTLAYDLAVMGTGVVPTDLLGKVDVPTLVVVGGDSPEPLQAAARGVVAAVDGADLAVLDGADHGAGTEVLAPVLSAFLAA
jgi:pimeloyl-ACP methyl ester carboxylesterase